MNSKAEFYSILLKFFPKEDKRDIEEVCEKIEADFLKDQVDLFYYDACIFLFYSRRVPYLFWNILRKRFRSISLTDDDKYKYEFKEEEIKKIINYSKCLIIVGNYFANADRYYDKGKIPFDLIFSIVNAITADLYNWENNTAELERLEECMVLKKLNDAILKGGKITRISIDIDGKSSELQKHELKSSIYSGLIWSDMHSAANINLSCPINPEQEYSLCESVIMKTAKTMVVKIAMIFYHYGFLRTSKKGNQYFLRTPDGYCIELNNQVKEDIYEILASLGKEYDKKIEGLTGFFRLRKSNNKYNEIVNREDYKSVIRSQLKQNKKESYDQSQFFSYEDIEPTPLGYLYKQEMRFI